MDDDELLVATAAASTMMTESALLIEQVLSSSDEEVCKRSMGCRKSGTGRRNATSGSKAEYAGGRESLRSFIFLFEKAMILNSGSDLPASQRMNLTHCLLYLGIKLKSQ